MSEKPTTAKDNEKAAPSKREHIPSKTRNILLWSSIQCAYTDCTNPLIEPGTETTSPSIIGEICHIHAISEGGARWNPKLNAEQLNSHENLILLCRNHHKIVDDQPEIYTAKKLRGWKRKHEEKAQPYLQGFSYSQFVTSLVDQKIEEEMDTLRKSRFFGEFDRESKSLTLGNKIASGDLSIGTSIKTCQALAWCARLLSISNAPKAEEYLNHAKTLGTCLELTIAEAFILSQKGENSTSLNMLATIDSPAARSAAFIIVTHNEGAESALDWLKQAGIDVTQLDSDGKVCFLINQLDLDRWDVANNSLEAITDQDTAEAPILHYLKAITRLLTAIPEEYRGYVRRQVPFLSGYFPIASNKAAMDARKAARRYFSDAAVAARKLNCPHATVLAEDYDLWLALADPDGYAHGKQRLQEKLRDTKSALHMVPLALQFGIKLDQAVVEKEIGRQIALNGDITRDAATARLALAFKQKSPGDAASYIARYYDELVKYIDQKSLRFLQIEMFSHAELPGKAKDILELLLSNGLSEIEESRLQRMISEAEGTDPVEGLQKQFEKSDSLDDLISLVHELQINKDGEKLCEYGELLFKRTSDRYDAEQLTTALNNTHRFAQLVEFVQANLDLLPQSKQMQLLYAWALYHEGALLESKKQLEQIGDESDHPYYRMLQINLGIGLGDWNSLHGYLVKEYGQRDKRSAVELMQAAQLAFYLDSPQAKNLLLSATAKAGADNDASVLANAYLLASNTGWKDKTKAIKWLQKAADLSNKNGGPLQAISMKTLLEQKPEWDRRVSEITRLLVCGEIPMFLAAWSLNKSLVDLTLFPALSNLSKIDPRRRVAIPAYSGKRQPPQFDPTGTTVGIDATALLTLSFLNLLDKALDFFKSVWIPHSTLPWLFEEQQNALFHQPSRIKTAQKISGLLTKGVLEKFTPSTTADSELADQIGDELALLIAEAEKDRDNDAQRVVVRSSPVYRISSLMEEEADLTPHASVLTSCLPIVKKLRQKGQITKAEWEKARAYLQLYEKPWPNEPKIADNTILYLDSLTITHFLRLGILEKLKAAGLRSIVSPKVFEESDNLIDYENIADNVKEAIERIKEAVSSRIATGKIKVCRRHYSDNPEEQTIINEPNAGVVALIQQCDAVISDDRCFNQHVNIGDGSSQATVFSTLDLLDTLVAHEKISIDERLEYRTKLRRGGYFFIPVTEDELLQHLKNASDTGEYIETAELKAIRENMLQIRMHDWLQIPEEAPWLAATIGTFSCAIRSVWTNGADLSIAENYSDWLFNQIDARGWAHRFAPEHADNIIRRAGRVEHILILLISLPNVQQKVQNAYNSWVKQRILSPIKEQSPELYVLLLDWYKGKIAEMIEAMMAEIESNQDENNVGNTSIKSVAACVLNLLPPPLIRESLLNDAEFRQEYGLVREVGLTFPVLNASFERSQLFATVRKALTSTAKLEVTDTRGRKWQLSSEIKAEKIPNIILSYAEKKYNFDLFAVLSPKVEVRLRLLEEFASGGNLPANSQETWRNILTERALEDDDVDKFQEDMSDTPVHFAPSLHDEIQSGKLKLTASFLVPASLRYFERLVGVYDDSVSIREYASGVGKPFTDQLISWRPYGGFLLSLLLSSHATLTAEIDTNRLKKQDIVNAYTYIEQHGDILTQLGAIEVGFRILPRHPEIEPFLVNLIKNIRDEDVDGPKSEFKLFLALFVLVDGELSRTRLMSTKPPFYRRLASMAQAALIQGQFVHSGIEYDSFCDWAFGTRRDQFLVQSLVDMRLEPRWNPAFASANQMKAEFFGRIIHAAGNFETNIKNSELYSLTIGPEPTSLHSIAGMYSYFPGPLEGTEVKPQHLPAHFSKKLEEQLDTSEVKPSSFFHLINCAILFCVDTTYTKKAAQIIKLGEYRLTNIKDKPQLLETLHGLAMAAAVSRDSDLADGLRILVRRYRLQYRLQNEEYMAICFIASASRKAVTAWRDFFGEWLTELAFGDISKNDAKTLHDHIRRLCDVVPELWVSCGKADAALMAFNEH